MKREELVVKPAVLSDFQENAYIVAAVGSNDCVVIDPGMDPEPLLAALQESNLTPRAFLITHGHWDHIGGLEKMKELWPDAPIIISALERYKLTDPAGNLSAAFGFPSTVPDADRILNEGDSLSVAGLDFHVGQIPGHARGHLFFQLDLEDGPVLFVGDIIFDGSIGRSDFPDSNGQDLIDGIKKKIMTLPDETILYPGHGGATTIGIQRFSNPWLRA
ncbi:MAG: MBL fold metallo-hydrolase [Planctomycetia bacterium]|nr:MBL fold metallo-hydrolase [Planctomycetia bacterium]